MSTLTLRIVTPEGVNRTIPCDSVSLWMAPDSKGRGEGSIGIRKGHADAVIALGNGKIEALEDGKPVFSALSEGGFATVRSDVISVISTHISLP